MVKRVKYILHVLASIDKGLILTIHWHNRTENVQNRPRCHEQVQALFSQSSQQPTIDIGAASDVKSDIIELIDSTRKWSTKGMQRVLEERRFKVAKLRAKCSPVCPIDTNCCMARLLSQQDDFKNQPSMLVVLEGMNVLVLGLVQIPLSEVEKKTFLDAKEAAQRFLEECPKEVQRFINRSWRFMSAYRKGLR